MLCVSQLFQYFIVFRMSADPEPDYIFTLNDADSSIVFCNSN